MATCPDCDDGFVYDSEHHPSCTGEGECRLCPVQVRRQCSNCAGGDTEINCGFGCGRPGCDGGCQEAPF